MSNLFQIGLETFDSGNCHGLAPIVRVIKNGVFPIVQIGIPLLLIVFGTIDLGKAVISSDDKEVKAAQSRLIKRCIYAVAVFFVATLVSVIMTLVATTAEDEEGASRAGDWRNCWNEVK